MQTKTLASAAVAGIAGFLVVYLTVSSVPQTYVEFFTLLAMPTGVLGGAGTAAIVSDYVGRDASPASRGLALAIATFGVAFLVLYFGVLFGLKFSVQLSVGIAAVVGLLAGLAVFALFRRSRGECPARVVAGTGGRHRLMMSATAHLHDWCMGGCL